VAVSRASRVLSLARNRRPVRGFADRLIPPDVLECVIDCGRYAPSAKEDQPWRFVIVQEALTRHRLAGSAFNHPHIRTAPVLIVCCARFHTHVAGTGRPSFPMDVTAAAQSMAIAAADLGLASSWVTGFRESDLHAILEVPASVPVVGVLALGYPDGFTSLEPRRSTSEVLAWERWSQAIETSSRS
jgi:nitroreductase